MNRFEELRGLGVGDDAGDLVARYPGVGIRLITRQPQFMREFFAHLSATLVLRRTRAYHITYIFVSLFSCDC